MKGVLGGGRAAGTHIHNLPPIDYKVIHNAGLPLAAAPPHRRTLSISSASSNTRIRMARTSSTRFCIQSRSLPCVPITTCAVGQGDYVPKKVWDEWSGVEWSELEGWPALVCQQAAEAPVLAGSRPRALQPARHHASTQDFTGPHHHPPTHLVVDARSPRGRIVRRRCAGAGDACGSGAGQSGVNTVPDKLLCSTNCRVTGASFAASAPHCAALVGQATCECLSTCPCAAALNPPFPMPTLHCKLYQQPTYHLPVPLHPPASPRTCELAHALQHHLVLHHQLSGGADAEGLGRLHPRVHPRQHAQREAGRLAAAVVRLNAWGVVAGGGWAEEQVEGRGVEVVKARAEGLVSADPAAQHGTGLHSTALPAKRIPALRPPTLPSRRPPAPAATHLRDEAAEGRGEDHGQRLRLNAGGALKLHFRVQPLQQLLAQPQLLERLGCRRATRQAGSVGG